METIYTYSKNKSILFAIVLTIISLQSHADNIHTTPSAYSENNTASYFIIGGVLGFGIIIFLINSFITKNKGTNKTNNNSNVRIISHRHRYNHHRMSRKAI